MRYILTAGWEDGVADLTRRLVSELADGKSVLWLVSGGSNIPATVEIMNNIPVELSKNLSVSQADERYGDPGHADSNWAQLMKAGFSAKQAELFPVLNQDDSFEKTVRGYNQLAERLFGGSNFIIAQLGIGGDGHIAGILPDSPAASEEAALATGYEAPPLRRMTLTLPALRRLSAAYVFAFGQPKQAALIQLRDNSLKLSAQPAQILKELPEAYVYNDQVGDRE